MTSPPKFSLGSSAQVIKPPGSDGQDTYNVTMSAGDIYFTGRIVAYGDRAKTAQEQLDFLREQLCYLFQPTSWGLLSFFSATGARHIRCRAPALPTFGERFNNSVTFAVDLVADRPLWEGEEQTASAGSNYFNHRFPWFLPAEGAPFAISFASVVVNNRTPVDIFPIVEVNETYGQLVDILNETTGAFLSVSRIVGTNQKLVIDTERATVWLWELANGAWAQKENVLNWLSIDSQIDQFRIVPGANQLSTNKNVQGQKPIMTIRWREPFLGV